jgi:tetratricopeptide (TPR) repeat protein
MIMPAAHRTAALCTLLAGAALWCMACAHAAPSAHDVENSNALIMTAEIALQRDDCGRAAADYTTAAQLLTDAKLAQRAAEVALDCGQYRAAERATARWRALTPANTDALRASVRAELGLYRIDEARGDFEHWLGSAGPTLSAPPAPSAQPDDGSHAAATPHAAARAGKGGLAEQLREIAQDSGVPATLAMLRGVQSAPLKSGTAQLVLADLALDGWNYREAVDYGERALKAGAEAAPAQLLLARAHAGLGEAAPAVAAANAAKAAAPQQESFAAIDVLLILGHDRDAAAALEALRANTSLWPQAERRLGLLAFNRGDFQEAEHDFSDLLKDRESGAIAVYYLSAIAERRKETETALRGYILLAGTALEAAGRERAATMLYKAGQRAQALQLLRANAKATPGERLEAEIAQAQLLSNGGEGGQALARLDDALARFPGHPDLLYQRAIVLEKAGRTDDAVAALEALYRDRPADGEIANALGFILTDHKRELARAEQLINTALKAEPDNPAILDSLGWLEYRRGMARESLPLFERAYRLAQDGDIGAHWGEVLWAVGEKSKARETWSQALIVDPDNALIKAAEQRVGVPQLPDTGTGTSI